MSRLRQTRNAYSPRSNEAVQELLSYVCPDASLAKDRDRMYKLRSDILHGSDVLEIDQIVPIQGWTPTGFKEDELYNGMWRVTRTALRNWLKSPPSPSEE